MQECTGQASLLDLFAGHEIGRELKAMSGWLDDHRELLSVVARDLRRRGVKETGRQGLPGETVLRCALLVTSNQASVWLTLRRAGIDTPIGDNGRLMTLPAPP